MRQAIAIFCIALFWISMAVTCPGCKTRTFADQRAYKIHARHCKQRNEGLALACAKRKAYEDNLRTSKLSRWEGQDMQRERAELREALDMVEEPAELPDFIQGSSSAQQVLPQPADDVSYSVSRRGRKRRLPRHLSSFVPTTSEALLLHIPQSSTILEDDPTPPSSVSAQSFPCYNTEPDQYGVYRQYSRMPSSLPPDLPTPDDFCDSPSLATGSESPTISKSVLHLGRTALRHASAMGQQIAEGLYAPFRNASIFRLLHWQYTGSNLKSEAELQRLIKVLTSSEFTLEDVQNFNVVNEWKRIESTSDVPMDSIFSASDGWRKSSVKIPLPKEGCELTSEADAPTLEVDNVYHRSLLDIIKTVCCDERAQYYHWLPFKLFCKRECSETDKASASDDLPSSSDPESEDVRIFTELYTSDAMLDEYEKLSTQPANPEDPPDTEVAIVPLMLWSDSTHLADFGNASLWPVYLFFGFISKYIRSMPSSFSAHHLAYLPSLPHKIQEIYEEFYEMAATSDVLRFCKRELMQAIFLLVLDPEFMKAYEHGLLLECGDGILWRLFPRFFTYSADYPEKILLACIRYLACCPCPRCLIEKADIVDMGSAQDDIRRSHVRIDTFNVQQLIKRTRTWVFKKGVRLSSKKIAALLDVQSLVPTRSSFSTRLAPFGINMYSLFVPDLLHEFELGVWKAFFMHILRILHAEGQDRIQKLNARFRKVPTFGRDTIRRFDNNVSALKKLAARDYEDILQCVISVFEFLLPQEHNDLVLDLLFILATWHSLAKLRLHTTDTVQALRITTRALGIIARHFKATTCKEYYTYELPKEEAARGRRTAARRTNGHRSASDVNGASNTGKKKKELNLFTYKWHALGHYADVIVTYGPTDNYTTQTGELEHRQVKSFWKRMNKHDFVRQIAKHERRTAILRRIHRHVQAHHKRQKNAHRDLSTDDAAEMHVQSVLEQGTAGALPFAASDPLPSQTRPEEHYVISASSRYSENLFWWLSKNESDPAFKDFMPLLKAHILARLRGKEYDGDEDDLSLEDLDTVQIINNKIYFHKVLRVNYTTYDMRRGQDSINPRSHADIMLLSHEDHSEGDYHPYWYARVVGIFHLFVRKCGATGEEPTEAERMDILWVRWFGREEGFSSASFDTLRLPRLGFIPDDDARPFGFINPNDVLRAMHLIPAFAFNRTGDLLPPSLVRQPREEHKDYVFYYVNIFVDRDMFMRFFGGGIGHAGANAGVRQGRQIDGLFSQLLDGTATSMAQTQRQSTESELEHQDVPSDAGDNEDNLDDAEETSQDAVAEEEEDFGYILSEEERSDSGSSDEADEDNGDDDAQGAEEGNMGPEDGEDGIEDHFEVHGFAPL